MERETERRFVQCFVQRKKTEWLLHALNGKKRRVGVGRFCHGAEDLLNKEKTVASGSLDLAQIRSLAEQQ